MPNIPFPNIPDFPGVPAIPRSPLFPPAASIVVSGIQGAIWRAFQVDQKWGIWTYDEKNPKNAKPIFDDKLFPGLLGIAVQSFGGLLPGNLVGSASLSFGSLDYSKEMKVADFPIENGGFASYNKVELPSNPVCVLYFSGTETERKTFINKIDEATKSTDLFTIVTPEVNYDGYTLERYSYRRQNNQGAYMYVVEIPMREIRQVTSSYTKANPANVDKTKTAGSEPPVDNGKTQPSAPKTSAAKSIVDKVSSLIGG